MDPNYSDVRCATVRFLGKIMETGVNCKILSGMHTKVFNNAYILKTTYVITVIS